MSTQEFTITKVNYPKVLMFGEDYDFSKITVETDLADDVTISKIEGTWLDIQPPFDNVMGYYPLQITVTASNGAVSTTTVNVFAYYKPHDGYGKFFIYNYKGVTKLMSYDCSDNPAHNSLYCYNSTITIKDIGRENGYIGQQGYNFDEETKLWVYDKTTVGYHDYVLRVSFFMTELMYSNADVYEKDQTTLYYKADPRKENLPTWDTNIENRYVAEYTDVKAFDETIEAYFILYASYNSSKAVYAHCFRNLSDESKLQLKLTPKLANQPRFEHEDTNAEYCLLKYQNGKWNTTMVSWRKQLYTSNFQQPTDTVLGKINFMNGLQEVHNVDFSFCDIEGGYVRPFIRMIEERPVTEARNAKYRMKNDAGQYDVIHFETSMSQVLGLNDSLSTIEGLISDRYTKEETNVFFNEVATDINSVEEIAGELDSRLTVVEGEVSKLQSDLVNETNRATTVETDLQNQINSLDIKVEQINHAETGILKQGKDYTDSKITDIQNGAIKDLEGKLEDYKGATQDSVDELTGIVEANKVAVESATSKLDERMTTVEGKVSTLEEAVADLVTEDGRLASEIQGIKDVISGKGSDTLVFATYEEFTNAQLSPKTGDMAFVIENKRAYIYQEEQWIVFDEISTDLDLTDYIKKSEVNDLLTVVDGKLTSEIERALSVEATLQSSIDGLTTTVGENGEALESLQTLTETHQVEIDGLKDTVYTQDEVDALIDLAVTAQMPYMGLIEPQGKKTGHIWIETIA